MFHHIQIDEPIEKVMDDWDYLHEHVIAKFTGFRPVGENILGIRRRVISDDAIIDPKKGVIGKVMELGPEGIIVGKSTPFTVRVTPAGVPHRVANSFGFWHINDKDELYIPIPGETPGELGYNIVVMGGATEDETDSYAWFCDECHTMLYEHVVHTGREGLAGFWRGELEAVRTYNKDPKLRTCPECNHINPHGYCWNTAKDTPEEAAARLIW